MEQRNLSALTFNGRESLFSARPLRKGDKVTVVLRGAGVTSREDGHEVIRVSKGVAYTVRYV